MEFEGLTQTIFRVVILFTRQNQLTLTQLILPSLEPESLYL